MSGPSVVIVEKGGIPVRAVGSRAPILTVSPIGLGIAITLTDLGAPFVVIGSGPEPIDWNWQMFTLTVGDSGAWLGYSSGDIAYPPFNPPVGMISNQPTAVTDLIAMFQDVGSGDIVVVFHGDYAEDLQLLPLSIGGFALTPSGYSVIAGNTWLRYSGLPGYWQDEDQLEVVFGDPPQFALTSASGNAFVSPSGHMLVRSA